jgi:hypothetical protein
MVNTSDHTQIMIAKTPITNVLRATNLTTGERYTITNQNTTTITEDNSEVSENISGAVTISGTILPSSQDLVQVDYTWHDTYESTTDYFNTTPSSQIPNAIDWGKSNYIDKEIGSLVRSGGRYNVSLSHSVDRVYSCYYCDTQFATIQQSSLSNQFNINKSLTQVTLSLGTGAVQYFIMPGIDLIALGVVTGSVLKITNDLAAQSRNGTYNVIKVIDQTTLEIQAPLSPLTAITASAYASITYGGITLLPSIIFPTLTTAAQDISALNNVVSVISQTTGLELYATEKGGTFSGNTIYLATDVTQGSIGDQVIVYFNSYEIFNVTSNNGTVSGTDIVLSTDDILSLNNVLQPLNDIYNNVSIKPIFANYIVLDASIVNRTALSLMPFTGSSLVSYFINTNGNTLTSRQPVEFDVNSNITRFGPGFLAFTIDSVLGSGGVFGIRGTSWFKISDDIVVTQNNTAGLFDLATSIQNNIGSLSTAFSVAKVISLALTNGASKQTLSVRGYGLADNTYDLIKAIQNTSLSITSIDLGFILSQNGLTTLPLGSVLNITYYVNAPSISETIQFTNGRGILYSRFKYSRIDRFDLISGFLNPITSVVTGFVKIDTLCQPATSSIYSANYDYYAPTENEQLTVTYGYNNITQLATNAVEAVRTLTADVLVRLALEITVNITASIILTPTAINQSAQITNQALSALNNLVTTTPMGTSIDYSSLLRVITAINGISGADITIFDFVGSDLGGKGNRKVIIADQNQAFIPGTINVTVGTR